MLVLGGGVAGASAPSGVARLVYFDFDSSEIRPEFVSVVAAQNRRDYYDNGYGYYDAPPAYYGGGPVYYGGGPYYYGGHRRSYGGYTDPTRAW